MSKSITLQNQVLVFGSATFTYQDPSWTLQQGGANQSAAKNVLFSLPAGSTAKNVMVGMTMLDAQANGGPPADVRISIGTGNLTQGSFDLTAATWAGSIVAGITVSYFVFGDLTINLP
jgi:hypothetical protein